MAVPFIEFVLPDMEPPIIVLIGPPAAGKTTTGRQLASFLACPFIDTDAFIEEKAGKSISQIFKDDGEPHFRGLEAALVRQLNEARSTKVAARVPLSPDQVARSKLTRGVIACGAGLPVAPGNFEQLEALGDLVCLSAPIEVLVKRLATENNRPLLTSPLNQDGSSDHTDGKHVSLLENRLRAILRERKEIYDRAKIVIDTANLSSTAVMQRIIDLLGLTA